jgi:hypothetical protein
MHRSMNIKFKKSEPEIKIADFYFTLTYFVLMFVFQSLLCLYVSAMCHIYAF